MTKQSTPRDGWSGKLFRRLRKERKRSPAWIAEKTDRTAGAVNQYELDRTYPPHDWRDVAAKALGVDRRLLGVEGSR